MGVEHKRMGFPEAKYVASQDFGWVLEQKWISRLERAPFVKMGPKMCLFRYEIILCATVE